MRIAITGSSGFIGAPLARRLRAEGDSVIRLVRTPEQATADDASLWDPDSGSLDQQRLDGLDALVHLAGENIAESRWTASFKQKLYDSRVLVTERLVAALGRLEHPPKVFLTASAIGIYGDCGEELVDESSPRGDGFLASLAESWEDAASALAAMGCRCTSARLGIVLHPDGGALKKMLTPFRLGLGGCLGDGRQWMSWIARPDAVAAIAHILREPSLIGPVNLTAPVPVDNKTFTKTLGHILHRPTLMPVPATVLRLVFGQMADELLLRSTRVSSQKLTDSGFRFEYPEIDKALEFLIHKEENDAG